jgi:hypothetical protein
MVDFTALGQKIGGNALEGMGGGLNAKSTPLNSFVSKVNSTLGTNIAQVNPTAMLKSAASGQISSLFGGTQNANSPTRTTGAAFAARDVKSDLMKRLDPVTNFEWMAIVVNKSPGTNDTLPWYYIDEITVPSPNLGSTQKFVAGKEKKYAEWFTLGTCTVKIYSDISGLAFNFCNNWIRSVYRDDNFYQAPIAYKKDIFVFILDPTRKVVIDIQLLGCWPTAWGDYQLTSGAAAALESSLTLSVDDFKMNYDSNKDAVIKSIDAVTASTGDTTNIGIPKIPASLSQFQGAVKSAQDTINSVQGRINSALKF